MSAVSTAPKYPIRGSIHEIDDLLLGLSAERDRWLAQGLCAQPSDRTTAESAVAELYRRSGFREPEFIWLPSPPAVAEYFVATGLATPMPLGGDRIHSPPVRIAGDIVNSRTQMDQRIRRRPAIVKATLWDSLRTSLFDGVAASIRTLLSPVSGGLPWYGQQEAHRVAFYEFYRRTGLATFRSNDENMLDILAALVGSTGWWWAFDEVCVMSERPVILDTEPTPGGTHNERRLHSADAPALQFADGAAVYVQHGAIVPEWVVLDPTVERIAQERNVEVRRTAIERIGWDAYIDMAGLKMVDRSDDPGNPGCELQLFDAPQQWRNNSRILLTVNGSLERDGHRRRYGLHVPRWISSSLDAAGWTYGIRGHDYARLARRT
ncbi:DUF6745 domain-containing protein [Rhodococcoides yunnanense]|uniref:DUF6745 domain-containing protein n=1 Tax=Rhodococcoides yunnanense TaxID=278209 RepID=UPI0035303FEA